MYKRHVTGQTGDKCLGNFILIYLSVSLSLNERHALFPTTFPMGSDLSHSLQATIFSRTLRSIKLALTWHVFKILPILSSTQTHSFWVWWKKIFLFKSFQGILLYFGMSHQRVSDVMLQPWQLLPNEPNTHIHRYIVTSRILSGCGLLAVRFFFNLLENLGV